MSEPIVFLPGMMCDARLFAPQIDALSAQHTIMVAPLNYGSSVSSMAQQILANTPPSFALAGLSMGGIVAMEIVRQAPQRVSRLALLDTNPLAETPERQALRGPQIAKAQRGELRAIMRDEMKPSYLTDGPHTGAILDLCMAMAEKLGASVFCQQSQALRDRPDQCKTLQQYTGPTLILCGEDDKLCPVERHTMMKELVSDSQLEIIKNAGHLPVLEQPDQTNEKLINWLRW